MFLGRWNTAGNIVPRAQCQFVRLELPSKLSKAQAAKSIRLQIQRLEGGATVSFAWRSPMGAERTFPVWFWASAPQDRARCPEPLLFHSNSAEGLGIRACALGFELIFLAKGELIKTRWLSARPDPDQWQKWADECGVLDATAMPTPISALKTRPEAAWQFDHASQDAVRTKQQLRVLAFAFALFALIGGVSAVGWRLQSDVSTLASVAAAKEASFGEASAIQRKIELTLAETRKLSNFVSTTSQIETLARVSRPKLLGGADQAVLLEWDVRGDSIRMQIARPKGEYSLNAFLDALERGTEFKNIRLMPNPPAGVVVIQAQIR